MAEISFIILGECASKANARRLVYVNGMPRVIKSAKALSFVKSCRAQLPHMERVFSEPVEVHIKIYYASRRPDLDESALLDAMQWDDKDNKGVYLNDRQVRYKSIRWGLDKENPRAEIYIVENAELDIASPKKKR